MKHKFKSIIILMAMLLHFGAAAYPSTGSGQADCGTANAIKLGVTAELHDTEVTVPVLLNNQEGISSLQFDMLVPDGLTLKSDEDGNLLITKTDRAASQSLTTTKLTNGKVRVLLYSGQNTPFTGQSGAVVNLPMQTGSSYGSKSVEFSNIIVSDKTGTEYNILDFSQTFIVCKNKDVTGDGKVEVSDVHAITSVICGKEVNENADVNGDDKIDILDITTLISILCKE